MEHLLSQAAAELTVRCEVESTLQTLLHDVEQAHALEQSLRAHNELHRCRAQLDALRLRYEEREAAWEADRREKEQLGLLLLEEVVKLSAREVEGQKSAHDTEAKLRKLETEKRMAGGSFGAHRQLEHVEGSTEKEQNVEGRIKGATDPSSTSEQGDEKVSEYGESEKAGDTIARNQTISDATKTTGKETDNESDVPIEQNNASFVPHDLNETTLMNIFSHLDPMDVMNFAQTNKALLSKVNVMFGMGNGDENGSEEKEATHSEEVKKVDAQPSHPAAVSASVPPAGPSSSISSAAGQTVSSAPTTEAATSASSEGTKSSPKLSGMSGPAHKRQGSSASVATTGTTGSAGTANPFSQVSSWFSSSDASSATSVPPANNVAVASTTAAAPKAGSEIKLSGAMAASMASKLTPAELSVILRMREKLQKCEADANKWRLEKEDAVANLASVEAVKEFLVSRVRDTETAVQKQKEDMKLVEKKHLEDQEVIVFLDERVKELEKVVEGIKSNEAAVKKESLDVVNKNEKKACVLSDMLRFEREQMAANEKEWKAAKKVLVKEVKSCRARIVALEAEAGGFRQQNNQLKQGLMSLTHSGPASPRGRTKNGGRI